MAKGISFYFGQREDKREYAPPFSASGQIIVGTYKVAPDKISRPVVAFMHDYYSVSAEEQRQMALNTIALCELKYAEQEMNNV